MKQLNFIRNVDIIRSILYDQQEILEWIMELYCPDGFELDPTYSKGNFYKGRIPKPKYKFDILPVAPRVIQANSTNLPIPDTSIKSIIFDPPFIVGSRNDGKEGLIKFRFGYYKNINELWGMYSDAIKEFHRILSAGAVLIFKCQDTIDSGKQYLSHVKVVNIAEEAGFYAKDLFILLAKNRIISQQRQFHARKFHSYFLVFEKQITHPEKG